MGPNHYKSGKHGLDTKDGECVGEASFSEGMPSCKAGAYAAARTPLPIASIGLHPWSDQD